jgi:hypothetical protein
MEDSVDRYGLSRRRRSAEPRRRSRPRDDSPRRAGLQRPPKAAAEATRHRPRDA